MTADSPQAGAGAQDNPSIPQPPPTPPVPRTLASYSNPEARRTMARFLNR